MEKQTAVAWLQEQLGIKEIIGPEHSGLIRIFAEAKQMEKQQAHEYAEFAIRCDRKEMKILNFDGFINLE